MNPLYHFSIIGSGASAIYLLKHLVDQSSLLSRYIDRISIFEKSSVIGQGMPYSAHMTDRFNMSNISSEELPELPVTFVEWLRSQNLEILEELGVDAHTIGSKEVYSRLALGRYLNAQYRTLAENLSLAGITLIEFPNCEIVDVICEPNIGEVILKTHGGQMHRCDRVIIATGHHWTGEDKPAEGYYTSPWPICKVIPDQGDFHNFPIGTLGASLSAFDVISSLANRHGEFLREDGQLSFRPHPGTENFKIWMHSAKGLLPHLQFEQDEPFRKIYRHIDQERLLALLDDAGFLRLDIYFDQVCRPVLSTAFAKDRMLDMIDLLADVDFGFPEFVDKMTQMHNYLNAFEGMRFEMIEARRSVSKHQPIHWKEAIDDLIYTLNFHADLMPAEDHLALRSCVMPFLMNVVAAMPLGSGEVLLALYDAGKLDLIAGKVAISEVQKHRGHTTITVEEESGQREIVYPMFIDCSGQKPTELENYPFQGLVDTCLVHRARSRFHKRVNPEEYLPEERKKLLIQDNGDVFYYTGGVDIDGAYRLIGSGGKPDSRLVDIAFPHTSGVRPYSYGLQACSDTSWILVKFWCNEFGARSSGVGSINSAAEIYKELETA